MPLMSPRSRVPSRRARSRGQSTVEFALVVPILLMVLIAVADFGRYYMTALAVESAAREAADYGAFKATNWTAANAPTTTDAMLRRACTAVQGSNVTGYEGASDGTTCTNPAVTCSIVTSGGASSDCATYGGDPCSSAATEPACYVTVTLHYTFRTLLGLGPLPASVTIVRDSSFRISDLPTP